MFRYPFWWRPRRATLLAGVLLVVAAAALAPYLDAELLRWLPQPALVTAATPALAKGRMVDDYFAVEDLGNQVFAIGEPRYWQQNYSYLIVGSERALLFDAGSGTRDMSEVVKQLTTLPVTVLVSHLHYDHLGGIEPFDHVAMLDVPAVRSDFRDRRLVASRYDYIGFIERRRTPSVHVSEWWPPGTTVDLGGRHLEVLSTPGHTPNSAALYEAEQHTLFIGDFIYPGTLYAFLPGASLSAYRETTAHLLALLPPDATLWTAHCCRADGVAAPHLAVGDLQALATTLAAIEAGDAHGTGFYPRTYPVNGAMTLAAGFPWNNR